MVWQWEDSTVARVEKKRRPSIVLPLDPYLLDILKPECIEIYPECSEIPLYVDSVVAMKDLHEFQKMFVSSKQSFEVP